MINSNITTVNELTMGIRTDLLLGILPWGLFLGFTDLLGIIARTQLIVPWTYNCSHDDILAGDLRQVPSAA